jgi:hypothetical protein
MPAPNKATPKKTTPEKPAAPLEASAAFAMVEAEARDLDPSYLVAINIDIPTGVSVVLGALPAIRPLRDDIATELPKFPIALFDKLETYALAAWYAHLVALPGPAGNKQIKDLLEEAAPLRANLLADAEALARRGLLPVQTVAEIRAGHGHVDTANDLVALAALFSSSWSDIQGKTAATQTEVQQAALLGPQLLAALGVRDQGRVAPREAAERRTRTFSLMVRAYDQTRRAVSYLRWDEGDADSLAPSLYKGRGGRPASDSNGTAAPEASPAPVVGSSPAPTELPGASPGSSPA